MRWLRAALALAAGGAVAVAGLAGPTSAATSPRADRVLIVAYPGLTWAGVEAAHAPTLSMLLARSAVASASVQTAADRTTQADGYVTIGAGNRADVGDVDAASLVAEPTAEGFVVPGAAALRAHNDDLLYGAKPGALGTALQASGHPAAVVGAGTAALAVMDATGRGSGQVGPEVTTVDAAAIGTAFAASWQPGATVLVQLGAPEASDPTLQVVLDQVDLARDLVLVVSPSAPADRAELTVFAMAGAGRLQGKLAARRPAAPATSRCPTSPPPSWPPSAWSGPTP